MSEVAQEEEDIQYAPEKPEPDELEYGLLVEDANKAGIAEAQVQTLLADNGMIVERDAGEIMIIGASWEAIRKVRDMLTEYGALRRKAKESVKQIPFPNWSGSEFKDHLEQTYGKVIGAGFSKNDFLEAFQAAGLDKKIDAHGIERLAAITYKMIATKELREFAGKYGVTYPIENTVGPEGLEWAYAGFKGIGELPESIAIEGQEYRRLDLIERELGEDGEYVEGEMDSDDDSEAAVFGGGDSELESHADLDDGALQSGCGDDAVAGDNPVVCDVAGVGVGRLDSNELIENACRAWRYLACDANWTEADHRLLDNAVYKQLEIGGVSVDDMHLLVKLASDHQEPAVVQGEVVEPGTNLVRTDAGNLVNADDGEVVLLCERLGFTAEHAKNLPAMTEQQAADFVEKIRSLQNSTIDIITQAKRYFIRNMRAIEAGMMFYSSALRNFAEPQLPRYVKDTKTHKAGDLKKKSLNLLTGDICFRGVGGWTIERKPELDKHCADQLADLTEQVQALSQEFIAGLPEPYRSIVVIDWKIKADRKKALAAAEAGHQLPGVNYLPKHDTEKMMIGINGKPVSITKPVEEMNAAIKAFKSACVSEDDDE